MVQDGQKHNGIRCKNCGATIVSIRHVHDFVECDCGKCAVDGGLEYTRIVGNESDYEVVPGVIRISWSKE